MIKFLQDIKIVEKIKTLDPDSAYINRDRIVLKVCQLQDSLIDLNKTTQWQLSEKQKILQGEITDY